MASTVRRVNLLVPLVALTLALVVASCGSDDSPSEATTSSTEPEATTTPPSTEPDRTEERKGLVLAPVVSSGACPPDHADPTAPVAGGGTYSTADGVFCYTVGAPAADGNDLTDATLSETDGSFLVYVRVKPDSVDKLDGLFNSCYAGEPTCPPGEGGRGYVAIIWDGTVLYAPAIQAPDIAESGLSMAGGLTERRARALITLINR